MVGGSHNKLTAVGFDSGDKNPMLLMQQNIGWLETIKTERIFQRKHKCHLNTFIINFLVCVTFSILVATSDHSVASVALATTLTDITVLETLLQVSCLSTKMLTELAGLLFLMHLKDIDYIWLMECCLSAIWELGGNLLGV